MCGLAGIFAYGSNSPLVNQDELLRMREHMRNRGPDGAGLWMSADQKVGFAHRRLSIIDLSDSASQPMQDAETGHVVVFNGEIYNYAELRIELIAAGHQFRSNSDTEVLLKLYAVHGGEAMLRKLRGMYAFALWDARQQSLFIARDPLGIKPLYYADDGYTIRFASQVKALLKGGAIDTTPEPAGHVGFFIWGAVPEPFTLYKQIRALPAGHSILINKNSAGLPICSNSISNILSRAYDNPLHLTRKEAIEYISEVSKRSIGAHLVADVPVGVFLSSGLDSAMIAANAIESNHVKTITLGFGEYKGTLNDETELAECLARQLNTEHDSVFVEQKDFYNDLNSIFNAMDQPSIDGINTWFVSKAASSCGLKVALSGLGGDEIFASYPSFSQIPKLLKRVSYMKFMHGMGENIRKVSHPLLSKLTSPKYAGLLEYGNTLNGCYMLRRSLFMPWELRGVMDHDMVIAGLNTLEQNPAKSFELNAMGSRLEVTSLEISRYMQNQLLRDADWAGMAHSLEIRVPFVDVNLIYEAARIFSVMPDISKSEIAMGVAKSLHKDFLQRKKTGFSTPTKEWVGGNNKYKHRGLRGWALRVYEEFIN